MKTITCSIANDAQHVDGFISKIQLGSKVYGIKAYITEIHPISCPKCGGSFELKYGHGQCPFCNTWFTTEFKLKEV